MTIEGTQEVEEKKELTPEEQEAKFQEEIAKDIYGIKKEDEDDNIPEIEVAEEGESEEEAPEIEIEGEEDTQEEGSSEAKEPSQEELDKEQADLEVQITELAEKRGIEKDEARKEIESISKIATKYENDPKKIAQAYLHQQKANSSKDEEIKQLKEQATKPQEAKATPDKVRELIDNGELIVTGQNGRQRALTRDAIVDGMRSAEPKFTIDMDDDKVVDYYCKKYAENYNAQLSQKEQTLPKEVAAQRITIKSNIPSDIDTRIAESAKAVVDEASDSFVMGGEPKELMDYAITTAKGMLFDELVKEREEAAYKRGKSDIKLREKKPPVAKGGTSSGGKAKAKLRLTVAQNKEALEMFPEVEEKVARLYYADVKGLNKKE